MYILWFPRASVGTESGRACVPCLQVATLARRDGVPTLARGNEKKIYINQEGIFFR